jgi:hypothetical protein
VTKLILHYMDSPWAVSAHVVGTCPIQRHGEPADGAVWQALRLSYDHKGSDENEGRVGVKAYGNGRS